MYENDNFSGYETGNENTTGTFSGVSAAESANGYTTYQMGGSTGSNTEPKNSKKHGGYFRKAMVSVSLGLFFGLFAGIGFYAVQQGTGMLKTGTDTAVVGEVASEAATESSQSTPQLATNVTYVESDVSDVVEKVMPAMVSIVNNFTETANVFGQQYTQEEAASGSGIIVGKTDDELLIVSNNHVVESADTLTVTFIDGSEAQAQVKGLDSDMDLAVIAVSLNDFDTLFKQQHLIEQYSSEIVFMHRLDLNSVVNVTEIPCVVVTDTMDESEILRILKSNGVKGVSGMFISSVDMDFNDFKEVCMRAGIKMTSFESMMDFSEFKLNSDGLIPVIVQDYKTNEVLMMAYMNEEAFDHTVKTGRMTYYSRSRNAQWVKGETSGHFQYVKSLSVDCDKDTLLAKVDQVGAACHTGNRSCFYTTIVGTDYDAKNPLQVFESVYNTIVDRKQNPKEGSYTNYLFEKGIDKILKKVGEEATEIVIAAKNPNPEEIKYEISDFLYHAMVLMVERGVTWEDITSELADR